MTFRVDHRFARRLRRATLLAGAAGGSIATALVLTAGSSAHTSGARTITIFEASKGSTFGFVDNPPKTTRNDPHASIGDVLAFSNPVFDRSRTHRLGVGSAQCTATRAGAINRATYACYGTYALNDGTISVAGLQRGEPERQLLAVVGGTGAYNGARGTLVARMLKTGSEDTITLLP